MSKKTGLELPEPVGYLVTKQEAPIVGSELKINRSIYTKNEPTGKHQKLYTEQQVRALLATGGQGRAVDAAKHPLTGNAEWQIEEAHKDLDRMGIPRDDGEDNYSVWGRFTLAFEQIAGMRIHIPYTDPDKPVTYESVGAAEPQLADARDAEHIKALIEVSRMPNQEHVADAHNAAVRHLRAIAAQRAAQNKESK